MVEISIEECRLKRELAIINLCELRVEISVMKSKSKRSERGHLARSEREKREKSTLIKRRV